MNPTSAWSVGLTLDTLGNKICLMNAAGHIICQRTFSPESNVPAFVDKIPSHLMELVSQYQLEMDDTTLTTVSVPGVVNTDHGLRFEFHFLAVGELPTRRAVVQGPEAPGNRRTQYRVRSLRGEVSRLRPWLRPLFVFSRPSPDE